MKSQPTDQQTPSRAGRQAVRMLLLTCLCAFAQTCRGEDLPIAPGPEAYGLENVEDVRSLLPSDAEPYYGLLHHAASVPPAALRKAGREFIQKRQEISHEATFPDMLHHPQAFRGQPVYLRGHLLQSVEYAAEPNPYGIERLYEAALFTDDSIHHPLTVVFLEKPPELKLGSEMVGSVAVSGYFLKMYIYPSNDHKTRKAPLILAKTITVFPPPKARPIIGFPIAFGLVSSVLVVVCIAVWIGFRRDQRRLRARRERELNAQRPSFD